MIKKCIKCLVNKSLDQFYKGYNSCKDCLNYIRRSKYKMSSCRQCNIDFRPEVKGRYKFCTEMCRFMNKIRKENNGCWIWQGGIHKDGYGDFVPEGGRSGLAHRASFRLFKGPIKENMLILHSCHKPACVNPDHLREGSDAENMQDKSIVLKGRIRKGQRCHNSKLLKHHKSKIEIAQVLQIRKIYETTNRTYASIAESFGLKPISVRNIVKKITWKHI